MVSKFRSDIPKALAPPRGLIGSFSSKCNLAGSLRCLKDFFSVSGPQSSAPVWFHILFYLSVGIMFSLNTVLYVKIHRLQREKKYNLEVPLVSEQGKKANSFQQVRSDGVYEEVTATASQTTPKEAPDGPRSSVGDCGPEQPEPLPPSDSTGAQTSQS
jgi:hypothetical protein